MLPEALRAWGATRLCFEWDSEEYALARDAQAARDAAALGCAVVCPVSNTLYDPRAVIAAYGGRPPLTYTVRRQAAFRRACQDCGAGVIASTASRTLTLAARCAPRAGVLQGD